jgi:hypothetical protein
MNQQERKINDRATTAPISMLSPSLIFSCITLLLRDALMKKKRENESPI